MNIDEKDIKMFGENFKKIEYEISNVIIGQKEVIKFIITAVISGGNVLLEGLPGLGKTQLVKAVGKVLDLEFSRIQFTPDLMPADVTGTNIMDKSGSFTFQKGPIFANIVLADEINRATPKTQSALLEAMQEGTVTSGNNTFILPKPFFVLATQNPLEMDGTYPLPEAQMDRFMFKLDVKFPSKDELYDIVQMTTGGAENPVQKLFDSAKLLEMHETAKMVAVARPVGEYAMDIVVKSHPEAMEAPMEVKKYIRYGSSPRGAQALISAAKVIALTKGRYNVAYEDIREAALNVLRHRIFLNFDAVSDGISVENIIEILLKEEKV